MLSLLKLIWAYSTLWLHHSLEPENNFLDNPLNTLMDIKTAWHMHPKTCIDVSSADILQFAIFFATTRQKHIPEPLVSFSATANAKWRTLLDDFFWGRPDESQCDIAWTENLPGFITPASGGPIPARCTAAGGEIKNKMMDRNGFSAGASFPPNTQKLIVVKICRLLTFLLIRGSHCPYWRPYHWIDSSHLWSIPRRAGKLVVVTMYLRISLPEQMMPYFADYSAYFSGFLTEKTMQRHVSGFCFHRVNAIPLHAYVLILLNSTVGAIFDNAYHDFLINTIIENDAFSFDINVHPFTDPSGIFPSWFRVMPPGGGLDHLDTDIALAFPSLNTSVHPNFHLHSIGFANSNDYFLKMFFVALQKMSKLGVKVELFPATHCELTDCTGVKNSTDADTHFLDGKPI